MQGAFLLWTHLPERGGVILTYFSETRWKFKYISECAIKYTFIKCPTCGLVLTNTFAPQSSEGMWGSLSNSADPEGTGDAHLRGPNSVPQTHPAPRCGFYAGEYPGDKAEGSV